MSRARLRIAKTVLSAVVVLMFTVAVGVAATAVRYTGATAQHQTITFSVSGRSVGGISVKLDDTCPDGHTLRVTVGTGYFPPLALDRSGRFSATVHPPNASDQPTTISGAINGTTATGSISDTTMSTRENALCQGQTSFSASQPGTAGRPGTATYAFKSVLQTHLHPVPLWPTYLPDRIRMGQWTVESLRGVDPYPPHPDFTASGPGGFSVFYGYRVSLPSGGFGGGGFSRTTHAGLHAALRAARLNYPERHLRLGGRTVVRFRLGSTSTRWAFADPSGVYVFESKDYGGPSSATIGRMIASMRPITHLRPPALN